VDLVSLPPESPTVTLIRSFVGCSLDNRRDELAALVAFPGDNPAIDVQFKTNCGMFALGIWRRLGCRHPLLMGRYKWGMAIGWVLRIAADARALHQPHTGNPGPGDLVHYATPGKNDDHVEFVMSAPDAHRLALHAGAGRVHNGVTESDTPSDYTVNAWRPLAHWVETARVINYGR
jgi:hypothetical protein